MPRPAHGRDEQGAWSRRDFLILALKSGVALGFASSGAAWAQSPQATAAESSDPARRFEPTIWYSLGGDGAVVVHVAQAEMGQHVGTALARIVAEELEADWRKVTFEMVDSDPKWGLMITGGSWSVWKGFPILSRAGAAGRMALIEEGAKLLGVTPRECAAEQGVVRSATSEISYGEIVLRGDLSRTYTASQLDALPIKTPSARRLIGRVTPALDIPAKVDGRGIYGIDAAVPGMIFARPKLPPTRYGCKVLSIDDSAARRLPGYIRSIALDDPTGVALAVVMVYADSFAVANRAADVVKVDWATGDAINTSEADIQKRAGELISDPQGGARPVDDAGVEAAFASAKRTLERTYATSTVMHFALEPVNALAFEREGIFEIHTGSQFQTRALALLAKALGRPADKIILRTYLLGGGFGRRLCEDYAVVAALAAQAVGRPVKTVFTRTDDMRFDCPRPPTTQLVRMAWDSEGKISAMEHHAAAGWPTAVIAPALLSKDAGGVPFDPFAINGADHWYTVGAQRVRALRNDLAERTFLPGYLRSVSPGWINWALESFMDEAAHERGEDPAVFRLRLLNGAGRNAGSSPNAVGGARRQARVLSRLIEKSGWGAPTPTDTGVGIATTFGQERDMPTWVACAARVRVDRRSGEVIAEKLTFVIDAGTIIDPGGAEAQVQGGILWGLSMALHEGTEFSRGQPKATNLDAYPLLRMGDVPEVDIEFLPSTEVPVGLGEPATTAVAPAIGNAIFAATGARCRDLPIRPEAVLRALAVRS
jgi:CO/xanthine dehydrogenase Mo-binding subunit